MTAIALITAPLDEATRNARVYRGDILVFRQLAGMRALRDRVAEHLRRVMGDDPESVHRAMNGADIESASNALRRDLARDEAVREALHAALREAGVEPGRTYEDGLKLRVQPPAEGARGIVTEPLGAHRDTWGSNVMAQTNWWAPVMPVTAERTIALFPTYFERPVANNSTGWDLAEVLRRRREGEPLDDYPFLPVVRDAPDRSAAVAMEIEPGDLMCFSGAHLHASVPNTTDRTRFSLEIRTVNADDIAAGRGAPNVDGEALRTAWQWFRRLSDGERLGEMG
jgi:hypothetical protein